MTTKSFEELFSKVPVQQREQLQAFRRRHPLKRVSISGVSWHYYSCGSGRQTLVLLAGGARFADVWFHLISAFEDEYRIIAPTDPGVPTVTAFVNGVSTILDIEHVDRTHVLGTSLGGLLAQCLVRAQPSRFDRLILSNTFTPGAIPRASIAFAIKLANFLPKRLLQLSIKWNMAAIMSPSRSNRAFWKAFWAEKSQTHLLRLSRDAAISQHRLALDLVAHYRFTPNDLGDWTGVVGLIASDNDLGYIRRDFPRLLELYPQARVLTLHAAGHTPGYTRPDEYCVAVKELLTNGN